MTSSHHAPYALGDTRATMAVPETLVGYHFEFEFETLSYALPHTCTGSAIAVLGNDFVSCFCEYSDESISRNAFQFWHFVGSLTLKMSVVPQQCHKAMPLTFQFQDQDSSSSQLSGQSYPEVGSAQSGQFSIQYSNSCACSALGKSGGKSVDGLIRSSVGSQDFAFPSSQLGHNQSLAHVSLHHAEPCFSGLLAAYGLQSNIHHAQLMGMSPVRIPLPLDLSDEPIYVNAKQYHAILRRRQNRAKLEAQNKLIKDRKPYLHESRHLHALKRPRGSGGRFLNTKKLQESKLTLEDHSLDVSSYNTDLNLSGNMSESKLQPIENYIDGASTTTCSEVTSASNSDDVFQQKASDFRLLFGYPSHIGRNMQSYSADMGGGGVGGRNQHHLSVLM
ncbi:hypothetical protein RIF29_29074 [Crotalaria pallida]|uniref:Nuclear transcription factor Y subunit n=1 Tax=Crotalaria pallida TaxID=3830 RepID=A0AAN9EDY0_CROPI